jgi:hypothetical protein
MTLDTVRTIIQRRLPPHIDNPLLIVNKEIITSAHNNLTLKDLGWDNEQEIFIIVPKSVR